MVFMMLFKQLVNMKKKFKRSTPGRGIPKKLKGQAASKGLEGFLEGVWNLQRNDA